MKSQFLVGTALAAILAAAPAFAQMDHSAHQMAPASAGSGQAAPAVHNMGGGMMGGMMGGGMMGQGGMGCGMMGGGMGGGMGMMQDLGPEEQQKYLDATKDLRKKLHDKQFDYAEAARNPKTTRQELLKKKKEVWDLQQKLHEKAWEFVK